MYCWVAEHKVVELYKVGMGAGCLQLYLVPRWEKQRYTWCSILYCFGRKDKDRWVVMFIHEQP